MRFKMMALVAAASVVMPAMAQTADSAAAPAAKPKPKKEKKICRSADPNSYSRMTSVVCRTQAEWDRNPNIGNSDAGVRSFSSDNNGSR